LLRVLFILHIVYSVLHILYFCLMRRINLIIIVSTRSLGLFVSELVQVMLAVERCS